MLNEKSKFITNRFSKTESSVENKETEQRKVLKIDDKFWNKLRAKVGSYIGNPKYVDIVFYSAKKSIQKALHRISLMNPTENYKYIIVGNYDLEDGSIHFNIGPEDIPKEELAQVLTHELVHMLQDEMGKFPEMGKRKNLNSKGIDVDSPWEKEAYKLQEILYKDFLKHCSIY